jgi:oligoribonuclease (3'-5' exoribonuclease)
VKRKKVIIEHPFAGDVDGNVAYARRCMTDSLRRGEAPFASALLYAQPGVLDDLVPGERKLGIEAGLDWGAAADVTAVYLDRGISDGMHQGIASAVERRRPIDLRRLEGEVTDAERAEFVKSVTSRVSYGKLSLPPIMFVADPFALLWIDLETTGLRPEEDVILECAWRLTDFRYPYEPIVDADGKQIQGHWLFSTIRDVRGTCDPYVQAMHDKSGLFAEIAAAKEGASAREAWRPNKGTMGELNATLLALSQDWPVGKGARDRMVRLAGNSVDFDRSFLRKHLPEFAARLSHRVFDASNVYSACRSLGMPQLPKPEEAHRAEEDLLRSIQLARTCGEWILGRSR